MEDGFLGTRRILVALSQPLVSMDVAEIVANRLPGFRIEVAHNIREAAEAVMSGDVEVLFLDTDQVGEAGYEVLNTLRRHAGALVLIGDGTQVPHVVLSPAYRVDVPFTEAEIDDVIARLYRV